MTLPDFTSFFGVDFSGAKRAGDFIWVAEVVPHRGQFELTAVRPLTAISGSADREIALPALVRLVHASERALWGFDFPFGLPLELFPAGHRWPAVFDFVNRFDDAYECGMACVRRARRMRTHPVRKTAHHVRRLTDLEAKAPFDTFHYRIIYQTFHGLREVVDPLRRTAGTAVLPFQYGRLLRASRVLVECCPASVLKRANAPHQNYKQPAGGPLTRLRRQTRHAILDWLGTSVRIAERFRRVIMRNPGGDALDAVIAAVGAARAVAGADHRAIRRHARYPVEGHLFV